VLRCSVRGSCACPHPEHSHKLDTRSRSRSPNTYLLPFAIMSQIHTTVSTPSPTTSATPSQHANPTCSLSQADLIESLFQGTQQYYVTCSECERTSYTADTFQDLKLQVPFGEAAPPLATLHSAFNELLVRPSTPALSPPLASTRPSLTPRRQAPEMMRGAERYECEACARKVDAERGVSKWRPSSP